MNVLFIVNDAGVYGANLSLVNLIKSLDLKNSLVLIPSKGPLLFLLDKMNIAYLVIPFRFNSAVYDGCVSSCLLYIVGFFYYKVLNKYSYYRILKIVDDEKIDIIHTNDNRTSIGLEVASRKSIKHVLHIREFLDLDFNMRPFKPFKKLCKDFNESDSIICVSEAVKEHFHIQGAKARVIYNAVDSVRNLHNIREKKESYFLFCGSLSEKKGVFDAIYSFSKMLKDRDLQLYIAGTGPAHIVLASKNDVFKILK